MTWKSFEKRLTPEIGALLVVLILSFIIVMASTWNSSMMPIARAQGPTAITRPPAVVIDKPTITIGGATADTTATSTTVAAFAQIQWKFGTVAGTYSTCTVQAKTSIDGGVTYVNLGGAAAVTVTTGTNNVWTIIEQLGTTSVTTSAVSATVALGFGQLTKFTFACSGYGTSAPVTITTI